MGRTYQAAQTLTEDPGRQIDNRPPRREPDFDAELEPPKGQSPVAHLDMRVSMACENFYGPGEDRYVRLRRKVEIAVEEWNMHYGYENHAVLEDI